MEILTAKAESTTRTWLPHTHTHTHTTQPLTWQHDIKSHREHVDVSTVHARDIEIIYYNKKINVFNTERNLFIYLFCNTQRI